MRITNGADYIEQVKELIIAYTTSLGRDLSFQNLEQELLDPMRKYTAPEGEVLVALDENNIVWGMVAYHRLTVERCEMKRLYVNPDCRGMRLGEQLLQEIIAHAKAAGFKEIVLDTLLPMKAAISLYRKYGFEECEKYYDNPMTDVLYMKKLL